MSVYVLGSDVSHWNIDNIRAKLQGLWDEGYRFLYIKVTEGTAFEDPEWKNIYAIAKDIGFKVGPYHYFLPMVQGFSQGRWFWQIAQQVEWDMKPMLDVEEPGHYSQYPSKSVYASRVKTCLYQIAEDFLQKAIVYTSKHKWDTYVDTYVEEELFVAHWTTRPQPLIPRTWEGRGWTMWQFGIVGALDRDRFNGTWDEFLLWLGEDVPDLTGRVEALEAKVAKLEAWAKSFDG